MLTGNGSTSSAAQSCCIDPDVFETTVIGIYHPAAGFYNPELAAFAQEDVQRFAYYLLNPVDPKRAPLVDVEFVEEAPREIRDAAVDTEGLEDKPWGLSWSPLKQRGPRTKTYVWIYKPGKRVPRLAGFILFHNALHDLKILRAMGINTRGLDYGDTMVKLYALQLEPQSLKAAAYRHLGLKMREFEEVVRPHFNKVALRWLRRATLPDYPKPRPIPIADFKKRKFRIYKPWHAGRRIENMLRAYRNDERKVARGEEVEKPVKLEKRWADLGESNERAIGSSEKIDLTEIYQAQAERAMGSTFPDFSIFQVPHDEAVQYSGVDAAATALIDAPINLLLKSRGVDRVYEDMDRRAIPFVDRMQEKGMRVDVEKLKGLESDLEELRTKSLHRVQRVVGDRWFNPGSGDQVAGWLYSHWGLAVQTYTDSGRGSTSDAALQMLKGHHAHEGEVREFIEGVQDYRESEKYLGTFVRPIFYYLREDWQGNWRLHANFRITRVLSGRLSSHDPNVLALPSRTALGKKIRYIFIAGDGYVLVSADFSQLELRVGAHFSRDRRMREAFETGVDLHTLTASLIFKIPMEQIAKDDPRRYCAKIVNFAVFYGISARALLDQLYVGNIFTFTQEDCQHFIDEWFKLYSSVPDFQRRLWREAEKNGFVRTMFGRICYVPNLRVGDEKLRDAARRLAANFPVQGTGSDTTKRAEIRVHERIEKTGMRDEVWPILQMHDELLIESREERVDETKEILEACMTADAGLFSVPITADASSGRSWAEAKG